MAKAWIGIDFQTVAGFQLWCQRNS